MHRKIKCVVIVKSAYAIGGLHTWLAISCGVRTIRFWEASRGLKTSLKHATVRKRV